MWVVLVALRRPYTFVVLALLIAIFGTLAALRTPTDIFPNINIPVVSVQTMTSAYNQLYFGLAGTVVLIYLVIVVNFQSWLDPFIIITALPGALAGIVWMLFMTGTTLSVLALTGTIMCMGIATANSILVVSFAREGVSDGLDSTAAALEAGYTRFRPVLMIALAMVLGMLPMAFALGRAVNRTRRSAAPSSAVFWSPTPPRCSLFQPFSACSTVNEADRLETELRMSLTGRGTSSI